jgi:hypothetical protein
VPDIEPDDGDGPGGDGRGCHEEPELPGWADQVTGTTGARDETGPAAPRPEDWSAGALGAPAARAGVTPPASCWPGLAAAMAEAITTAETSTPAPAISSLPRCTRRVLKGPDLRRGPEAQVPMLCA